MTMSLLHLGLLVRDQERSLRFYASWFGFDAAGARTYPDGTVIVRNPQGFDLALHPGEPPEELPGFVHFGVQLPDPDAVRALLARMEADGVPIPERWDEPGYVAFKCLDPDGWRVEAYWEPPGDATPESSLMLDQVRRYFEFPGADVDRAHELYHDDAVLEFPQSGERFEGLATFTEWRRRYPGEVRYQMRRITTRDDLAVVELSISYNDGPSQYAVQLLEFRGDKIARERIYVMEGWDAPEWRAPWRSDTPADPPE